jgi:hypothetical protein
MKAMLAVPFEALTGQTGPGAFVFYHLGGRLVARSYVCPRQPDTPDLRLSRELHARVTAAWRALAPE